MAALEAEAAAREADLEEAEKQHLAALQAEARVNERESATVEELRAQLAAKHALLTQQMGDIEKAHNMVVSWLQSEHSQQSVALEQAAQQLDGVVSELAEQCAANDSKAELASRVQRQLSDEEDAQQIETEATLAEHAASQRRQEQMAAAALRLAEERLADQEAAAAAAHARLGASHVDSQSTLTRQIAELPRELGGLREEQELRAATEARGLKDRLRRAAQRQEMAAELGRLRLEHEQPLAAQEGRAKDEREAILLAAIADYDEAARGAARAGAAGEAAAAAAAAGVGAPARGPGGRAARVHGTAKAPARHAAAAGGATPVAPRRRAGEGGRKGAALARRSRR